MIEYTLQPVGVVHSSILTSQDMPPEGVEASLEVFKEFEEGMEGIDDYSHIIILFFCHRAERSHLRVRPRMGRLGLPEKGVFATRSPDRPNPIALSVVKIVSRDGRMIKVDDLDAIDGTPVIDFKPYLHVWDCVFSAKTGNRFLSLQKLPKNETLMSMMKEASNFHGDTCAGVAIGVRMVYKAFEILKCDPRRRDLEIISGVRACITDGIQASTGATNKRLRAKDTLDQSVTFQLGRNRLRIDLSSSRKFRQADDVLSASDSDIFASIKEERSES